MSCDIGEVARVPEVTRKHNGFLPTSANTSVLLCIRFCRMRWSNFPVFPTLLFLTLSLRVAILPSLATQPFKSPSSNVALPPPKGDAPDDTAGGSSRDGGYCPQDQVVENAPGFTVVMPTYAETKAERPTFSFYIPETTAKKIFFTIKDADESYYYQTIITLPGKSGQLSFQLPTDAPAIKTNQEYTWSVGLICQQVFDPNDPTLTGVIKRVEHNKVTGNSIF